MARHEVEWNIDHSFNTSYFFFILFFTPSASSKLWLDENQTPSRSHRLGISGLPALLLQYIAGDFSLLKNMGENDDPENIEAAGLGYVIDRSFVDVVSFKEYASVIKSTWKARR